jgi:uncharacterized membrane protein YbhN (UPF0104 family)
VVPDPDPVSKAHGSAATPPAARSDRVPSRLRALVGRGSRGRSVIGFIVGAVLLLAAVIAVVVQGEDLGTAVDAVRNAPPWLIAAALALPVANWLSVSAAFAILTQRFGRVGLGEMTALIGSAWLLNHLPMRPGLVGRVAYHKAVNQIRVADSARVILESIVLSAIAVVVLLAVAVIMLNERSALAMALTYAAPLAAVAIAWTALGFTGSSLWRYAAALFFKLLDMSIWVARYAVVFALVGAPLDAPRTVLVAAISQVVLLIPISGNGIGLREWAVEFTAEAGLQADLLNRAAETLVVIPIGAACTWWVARRLRDRRRVQAEGSPEGSENPLDLSTHPADTPRV